MLFVQMLFVAHGAGRSRDGRGGEAGFALLVPYRLTMAMPRIRPGILRLPLSVALPVPGLTA